jgi:hypothetical protein
MLLIVLAVGPMVGAWSYLMVEEWLRTPIKMEHSWSSGLAIVRHTATIQSSPPPP